MNNDDVVPLNYCAHAIEDLRVLEQEIRDAVPKSALAIRRIIQMLQQSAKFILPNCCEIFQPEELKQSHLDLVRLPFPCVAFEAPWEKEDGVMLQGEFKQAPATKRIALCWEMNSQFELLPGLNASFSQFSEGGVFILPVYWGPEHKTWTLAVGGLFFPYNNLLTDVSMENLMPASLIANAALVESGRRQTKKQYRSEPFHVLPELFEQFVERYGGLDKAYAQVMLDAQDESMMLVQACSVLNCSNVETVDLEPSAASNKKRVAKGKQPFFTYKVLQITEERNMRGAGQGGTHAEPRMHLRRGHLRRLEDRTIWVRAAIINAGTDRGVVVKDYEIQP